MIISIQNMSDSRWVDSIGGALMHNFAPSRHIPSIGWTSSHWLIIHNTYQVFFIALMFQILPPVASFKEKNEFPFCINILKIKALRRNQVVKLSIQVQSLAIITINNWYDNFRNIEKDVSLPLCEILFPYPGTLTD